MLSCTPNANLIIGHMKIIDGRMNKYTNFDYMEITYDYIMNLSKQEFGLNETKNIRYCMIQYHLNKTLLHKNDLYWFKI